MKIVSNVYYMELLLRSIVDRHHQCLSEHFIIYCYLIRRNLESIKDYSDMFVQNAPPISIDVELLSSQEEQDHTL